MLLMRGEIKANGMFDAEIPNNFNTLMYLLDGKLEVNGKVAKRKDLIWFANEGETINISANEDTRFIILSGEPIGEKNRFIWTIRYEYANRNYGSSQGCTNR